MRRGLRQALEELYQRYHAGPVDGDCEGDFDFGFVEGMKVAYDNMTEDLTALIGQFYPDWKPRRSRRRK